MGATLADPDTVQLHDVGVVAPWLRDDGGMTLAYLPPCAVTAVDNANVGMIASVSHLS
jgi:hypothetical protein